jgi:hypothetical protein
MNVFNDGPFPSAPPVFLNNYTQNRSAAPYEPSIRRPAPRFQLTTSGKRSNVSSPSKKGLNGLIIAAIVMLAIVLLLPVIYLIAYPSYKKKNNNCANNVVVTSTPKYLAGSGIQQKAQQSVPRVMSTASSANAARFAGTGQTYQKPTLPGFQNSQGMPARVVDNMAMFPQNAGQGNYKAALAKAQAAVNASYGGYSPPMPAPARNTVTGAVVAGGGDVERSLVASMAMAQKYPDQTGLLPQVIAETEGASLTHAAKTSVRADHALTAFNDGTLASIDPEGAAKLDRAMSSIGVPGVWGMDAITADQRKKSELMKSIMLSGQIDPSIEDVLAASAPYVATAEMARRAIAAQGALDRSMIMRPATRFLNQNPLYRPAVATPTMSPFVGDNGLTPGQENYLMSIGCGAQDAPLIQETY